MKKFAPLIVLLLVAAVILAIYSPGIYRGIVFKRNLGEMLESAKSGNVPGLVGSVLPSQQAGVQQLLDAALPADYQQYIESLKLTSWRFTDKDTINAVVTLKVNTGDFAGIYQGSLVWRYDGAWKWDFMASKGAEFSPSGEPDWVDLGALIEAER